MPRTLPAALLPAALISALALAACTAGGPAPAGISVEDASVAPLLPGRDVTAAHMVIRSNGGDDALLSVRADALDAVEIHETTRVDGVARMRRIERLELPAGEDVVLEPGGLHLMLFGATPAELEDLDLTLVFERAGEVAVEIDSGPTP